jgi:hypothetical protein
VAKVYIVEGGEYEERGVVSVWTDPLKAQVAADLYSEARGCWRNGKCVADGAEVFEYELNG